MSVDETGIKNLVEEVLHWAKRDDFDALRDPAEALAQHVDELLDELNGVGWEGYKLGILHAAEFVMRSHGAGVVGAEIIAHLLSGENIVGLRTLAKHEEVDIDWTEVEARRRAAGGAS